VTGRSIPATLLAAIEVAAVAAVAWWILAVPAATPAHAASPCWDHVLQTVADLEDAPPDGTLVVLFGGSRAREATVTDAHWTKQLRTRSGDDLSGRNLASTNQTFSEDLALVEHLPTSSTIVLIGVDEGRFTKPLESRPVVLPQPDPDPAPYDQHRYSVAKVRSTANKEMLVDKWLKERYPVFREYHAANKEQLELLVAMCLERDLFPVLVATPWNEDIIGAAFREPRKAWTAHCEKVAAEYDVPFLDFSTDVGLTNDDFYDLFHLVEPGRTKWQRRLSSEVAALLASREDDAAPNASGEGLQEGSGNGGQDFATHAQNIGLGAVAELGWQTG